MNQDDLRKLADERIKDAKALIRGKRWEFAYYAAGYAIECALKSCVLARMIHTGWVFAEKWNARDCLTHDLKELIRLAGLTNELNAGRAASTSFAANWTTVAQWTVTSRYEFKTETEARELFAAITDRPHGVLRWLKNYW